MKLLIISIFSVFLFKNCQGQIIISSIDKKNSLKLRQDSIVNKYLKNGAWKHIVFSKEWQQSIDSGLKIDNTIAYLWQQKAMPYFKCGKYEYGMVFLDSAVFYDFKEYINYRAFIKCIFQKNYKSSLEDFTMSISKKCEDNIMDHTRHFYMGLCYLQLNDFSNSEKCFHISIDEQIKKYSSKWVSYLDKFYLAITLYELGKYTEAIELLDGILKNYEHFSDAKYYKALSLTYLGDKISAKKLLNEAYLDLKTGYTISEGNTKYEKYPYQIDLELLEYQLKLY